ncbi:hypothetical protein CR513_08056, partial [Mucuna pruriens]
MKCTNNLSYSMKSLTFGVLFSWGHSQSPMDIPTFYLMLITSTKRNNAKVVADFLKSNILCRFGVPKALISDQGSQSLLQQSHGNKEDTAKDDKSQLEGLEPTP